MDKYLKPSASFNRLLNEYIKYKSIIVAVDFDDTLYDYHKDGSTYNEVIQLLRNLYKANCYIIIYTGNEHTAFVTEYLRINAIPFHSINQQSPFYLAAGGKDSRKIYANAYLDDRAGLSHVFQELTYLLSAIKHV